MFTQKPLRLLGTDVIIIPEHGQLRLRKACAGIEICDHPVHLGRCASVFRQIDDVIASSVQVIVGFKIQAMRRFAEPLCKRVGIVQPLSVMVAPDRRIDKSVLFRFLLKIVDERFQMITVGQHQHIAGQLDKIDLRAFPLCRYAVVIDLFQQFVHIDHGRLRGCVRIPMNIRQLKDVELIMILHGHDVLFKVFPISHRLCAAGKRKQHDH